MPELPKILRDTATVLSRELTPELRSPASMVLTMGQPLLFLVLFGSMLAGTGVPLGDSDGGTWQWFVPGILVMMCLLGPLSAGHSLLAELSGGQLERFLVTPISRVALIVGRTAKDTVLLFAQTVLLTAIAVPLGMRAHPAGALATLALLALLAVGLSAMSYLLAIASQPSGNLFWLVTQMLIFPVMLLSGILLPVEAAGGWLQAVATINPLSYVVDAARALFAGEFSDRRVPAGVLVAAVTGAFGLLLATRRMRRGS